MRKLVPKAAILALTLGAFGVCPGFSQARGFSGGGFGGRGDDYAGDLCRPGPSVAENRPRSPWYAAEPPLPGFKDFEKESKREEKERENGRAKTSGPNKPDAKLEGAVVDEMGKPAREIEIHLLGLDRPLDLLVCTNAKGRYFIELEAGNYMTCVVHKRKVGLCRDFTLRHGQKQKSDLLLASFTETRLEDLLKRLPESRYGSGLFAAVQGNVFNETGALARGIEIQFTNLNSREIKTTSTDSHGQFSVTVLPGDLVVCLQYKGQTGLCRALIARRGRLANTDFDLKYFEGTGPQNY